MIARRSAARTRGQALVEFAITTPLLLLLFMGAVDVGRLLFVSVALEEAAQEGALYAALKPGVTQSEIEGRVRTSSNATEVTGATVPTVGCAITPAPGTITVHAHTNVALLTPVMNVILGSPFQIGASVTATNTRGNPCPVPP
jgi:Flp pilus assembly protein TadG